MDSLRQQSLIPSFLYSSSSSAKTFSLSSLHSEQPSLSPPPSSTVTMGSKSSGGFVIPAPSEPGKRIEMYSPAFYAACTAGGILSCGLTHMTVTPLDLVKCNMQVHFLLFSVVFGLDLCCCCWFWSPLLLLDLVCFYRFLWFLGFLISQIYLTFPDMLFNCFFFVLDYICFLVTEVYIEWLFYSIFHLEHLTCFVMHREKCRALFSVSCFLLIFLFFNCVVFVSMDLLCLF